MKTKRTRIEEEEDEEDRGYQTPVVREPDED